MDRHAFDPISLVFGLLFVAAGIIVLAGGSLFDDGHLLVPAGLIGLGLALLYRIKRPTPERHSASSREDSPGYEVHAEGSEDR